jgi:hypothetical protein
VSDHVRKRLTELKTEYEGGRRILDELEARQMQTRESLLCIGGAIQVLEELLAAEGPVDSERVVAAAR